MYQMKITDELVDHIAHLSRLKFEGEERQSIKNDLENIIDFMSKLSEVDTENVEPLVFMTDEFSSMREDTSDITLTQKEALKNAPKKDSDYFRIPKVLDKKA
jgi:aspartyl-tRNA(Asn)/glutamyl-tRNA(Gln) amidotransferase subunit C